MLKMDERFFISPRFVECPGDIINDCKASIDAQGMRVVPLDKDEALQS